MLRAADQNKKYDSLLKGAERLRHEQAFPNQSKGDASNKQMPPQKGNRLRKRRIKTSTLEGFCPPFPDCRVLQTYACILYKLLQTKKTRTKTKTKAFLGGSAALMLKFVLRFKRTAGAEIQPTMAKDTIIERNPHFGTLS